MVDIVVQASNASASHDPTLTELATTAAEETLRLFMNRYAGGVDTYLQVVTSQTTALGDERNDIDTRRRQLDAGVLPIKALGGDWNINKLPRV
jgi:outer membrane protein TolC